MSEIRLAFLKTIEYTAGAVTFNIFFASSGTDGRLVRCLTQTERMGAWRAQVQ